MKKSILLSSVATVVLLFTGCGGGGDKGGGGGDTTTGEKPVFASPSAYDAVAGEKRSVTLTVGENSHSSGNPLFEFAFVDVSQVSQATIDKEFGIIKFIAPSGTEDFNITVKATRIEGGAVSEPMTIVFTPVGIPAVADAVKPYKTHAGETTSNIDRNFTRTDLTAYNVKGPTGLIWADTVDNTPTNSVSYAVATTYCGKDLPLNAAAGITEQWRIPNKDELLNLIDYSKPPYKYDGENEVLINPSMIPENVNFNGFDRDLINVWAAQENDQYFYVSENNGVFVNTGEANTVPVRCVSGAETTRKRLMHTDSLNYTYDERTKLEWSPTTSDAKTTPEAIQYCQTHSSDHTVGGVAAPHEGFRLPSINELRSIIENGTVSDYIADGNRLLLSSTPYVDENGTVAPDGLHWRVVINWDGTYSIGGTGTDLTHRITCVRDMQE